MPIQTILFDYGSVLVQMQAETPRQQLADRLGVPLNTLYQTIFETPTAIQAVVGEITCAEHWQAVAASLNVPPAEIPALIQQFWAADGLNQELIEYIRTLRPQYRLGILSNAWDDLREMLIHRWQIADLFDEIIISAEVGCAKPVERIYRIALERLNATPEATVFVDDVLANVETAQAVGMRAIQYRSNPQIFQDLQRILEP